LEQNKNIMTMLDVKSDPKFVRGAVKPVPVHGDIKLDGKLAIMRGCVHELTGQSADVLALVLASALKGAVIWIGHWRQIASLTPSGMSRFVDPARVTLVIANDRREVLWAAEQALRTQGVACVIFEVSEGPNLTESRRLQIACEESGATGLALISGQTQTSAAQTRWQCSSLVAKDADWIWRCQKNKKDRPSSWKARWQGGAYGRTPKAGAVHLDAAPGA
jgi:protein ImuA